MTLFAHIADIHLGYVQYGLHEREEDIYQAFDEAIEIILKEHVEILLIAGDLFDAPKPPIKALIKAREKLELLQERGIEIFHVLGDHEIPRRLGDLPPTAILNGISKHVGLKKAEARNGKVAIVGLDRTSPSLMKASLIELKRISSEIAHGKSVLIAHIPAHKPERGFELLPHRYDYYALGHEHERKVLSKNGYPAAYPGSIEILSISEIESWKKDGKGFFIIDLSDAEPILHRVNLTSIRPQEIFNIQVTELEKKLEEAAKWVISQTKQPILHFKIWGKKVDRALVARHIQEKLSGRALHYRHEVFEEEEGIELEAQQRLDIRSMIREYMSTKGFSSEEIGLALAIYDLFISSGLDSVQRLIMRQVGEGDEDTLDHA